MTHLVYNVDMPINTKVSHRVQVTLTIEEYNQILQRVSEVKKAGYKSSVSKYAAMAIRNQLVTDELMKNMHDIDKAATK